MRSEDGLVKSLTRIFGARVPGVELGLGDDCAVLSPVDASLVWTVDAQVDEVHFRREWLTYGDVGFRAFAAAASDVVAMGAAPLGALSALTLDALVREEDVEALAVGQREASLLAGAPIVGGNLSRGGTFSVTTTVLGRVLGKRAVARTGARPGDRLLVSGPLGLARLGLRSFVTDRASDPSLSACVNAFCRPHIRYDAGATVARGSAAIDVSDGLALDASRLAAASGVRVVLSEAALLSGGGAALAAGAARLGEDPVECALVGGEDYVVLLAWRAGGIPEGFTALGRIEEGQGVALDDGRGEREIPARGHDHFEHPRERD